MKNHFLLLVTVFFLHVNLFGQDGTFNDIEFTTIAEGNDSPYENFQVVCFNKYFNLEQLPEEFRNKYNLADPKLFRKKMLIEIFFSDTAKQGLDKIEVAGIKENKSQIVIEYNIVNSDTTNDSTIQSPFIVVQIPKSRKVMRFIANGQELGKGQDIYIKN